MKITKSFCVIDYKLIYFIYSYLELYFEESTEVVAYLV